jgi:predicted nucleotidyltransferase
MNRRLLQSIKQAVLEYAGEHVVSLFVSGSFLSDEMTPSSDIDLVGVMRPTFDFRSEPRLNRILNETVSSEHRIDLGTMSYEEFFGGPRKGSVMKYTELPIFLNFLKHARLIYGKKIDFDKLPIKPASAEQELKYHIREFDKYKGEFRRKDAAGPDFSFRDFIKSIFYIANAELQLTRHLASKRSYTEIVRAFARDRTHIVHYSMRLRRRKTISRRDKRTWLNLAERYAAQMRTYAAKQ